MAEPTKEADSFSNEREVVKPKVTHSLTGVVADNIQIILNECVLLNITNPLSQIAILSLIGEESGMIPRVEMSYRNTSNDRLRMIFGKRLSTLTESGLTDLKKYDIGFFDQVYGGRMGNNKYGDGFLYRGRFFGQLTGEENYRYYSNKFNLPSLFTNPDDYNDDVVISAKITVDFMKEGVIKLGFDPNGFTDQMDALTQFSNANNGWHMFKPAFPRVVEWSKKFRIEN